MSDSVIIRRKVASNFTVLDNALIRDTRLSWKALGLLVYLLSLPPNFKLRLSFLSRERPSGRDATRSGLRELEQCGYLSIIRERATSGKFATTTWIVNDQPSDVTISENPNMDNPITENAISENPPVTNTGVQKELNSKTTTTQPRKLEPLKESIADSAVVVSSEIEVVLPAINHLPLHVQQDIVDEIEGKRRRGVLRTSPMGLAKYFAANPQALVLCDGLNVRRDREQAHRTESIMQANLQRQKDESQKYAVELAQMPDEEFLAMCSKLPPRVKERVVQQRLSIPRT